MRPILALFLCLASSLPATASHAAPPGSVDLIPPLDASSAKLRFHEGKADAAGNLVLDQRLPALPGPVSPWVLTQWNHSAYILPTELTTRSGFFGPVYSFTAADHTSSLVVQHFAIRGNPVFTLLNGDGTLTGGGGRATYLTAGTLPNVADSFDHEIDLAYSVRLSTASVSLLDLSAALTGAVMAQAYAGIGLLFVDPAAHDAPQFVFMQVMLTVSNAYPIGNKGFICAGATPVLFSPDTPKTMLLAFAPDRGALHPIRANLSAAVAAMIATPEPCGGSVSPWDAAKRNIANWHMTGIYIGSETENTDLRPGALTWLPQGHVTIGLDLSDLSITRRTN